MGSVFLLLQMRVMWAVSTGGWAELGWACRQTGLPRLQCPQRSTAHMAVPCPTSGDLLGLGERCTDRVNRMYT